MVATPLSCGASRSRTARALARSACSAFLSRSSASLSRAGPGAVPIALSRDASDGANGAISAGDLAERRRARIQRQLAGRVGAVEIAGAFQRHAVGLADLQLIERDRLRTVAELRHQRPQFLAGRHGAADIQRQLRLVRPFGLRARQRAREGRRGIEIETFRLQLAHRTASRRRPCDCETATRPSTAPPSISAFMASIATRSAADADIAAQPQRLLAAIGDLAAALQPRHQRIRIGGIRRRARP